MEECILVHEGSKKKNLGLLSAHGRLGSSMQRLKRLKKMKMGPCGTQS
jgi:hypothetical protein